VLLSKRCKENIELMKIEVKSIEPRDEMGKVFVKVGFGEKKGPPHNSAELAVFVDHSDSYSEIRKRAIKEAHKFFKEALTFEAVETVNH
jgi:hypothetical protein